MERGRWFGWAVGRGLRTPVVFGGTAAAAGRQIGYRTNASVAPCPQFHYLQTRKLEANVDPDGFANLHP